jgi:hypothetical protein
MRSPLLPFYYTTTVNGLDMRKKVMFLQTWVQMALFCEEIVQKDGAGRHVSARRRPMAPAGLPGRDGRLSPPLHMPLRSKIAPERPLIRLKSKRFVNPRGKKGQRTANVI